MSGARCQEYHIGCCLLQLAGNSNTSELMSKLIIEQNRKSGGCMALGLVNLAAQMIPSGTQILSICHPPQFNLDLSPHCPYLAASHADSPTPKVREAVGPAHGVLIPLSHTRF